MEDGMTIQPDRRTDAHERHEHREHWEQHTAPASSGRSLDDLVEDLDRLRAELTALRGRSAAMQSSAVSDAAARSTSDRVAPSPAVRPNGERSFQGTLSGTSPHDDVPLHDDNFVPASSRRNLLRLGGASAVGLIVGSLATGSRPVAAADPNDIVKNISNPVTDTTTVDGSMPGPTFSAFNRLDSATSNALFGSATGTAPTIRADNTNTDGLGGVGIAGNAPGGRDVHATGSGRIAMNDHQFGNAEAYSAGEIHQSGGTLYAMVSSTSRREIVGPGSAGALHPIPPTRVYDSRQAQPAFGRLGPGESRVISVADGRSTVTGAVTVSGLVPPGATAIMYNLTVADTDGAGFLNVSPASVSEVAASTINWTLTGTTLANSSMVGLSDDRLIRVTCPAAASTHFIIDVLGYYA